MTNTEIERYKKDKQLAKVSLDHLKPSKPLNGKELYRKLRLQMPHIGEAIRLAEGKIAEGQTLPHTFAWLYDLAHRYKEKLLFLKSSLKHARGLTGTIADGTEQPLYYKAFYTYLALRSEPCDELALDAFVSVCCAGNATPSFRDLYSFPALLSCAVLMHISGACETLLMHTGAENDPCLTALLEGLVKTLIALDAYDFDRCFRFSPLEALLASDPAGAYAHMDSPTKNDYRHRVIRLSEKAHMTECAFLEKCVEKARAANKEKERHIGFYLYSTKPHTAQKLYFFLLLSSTLALTALLCSVSLWAFLLLLPLWEACKGILDRIFSHLYPVKPLARLAIKGLPNGDGVLVVITSLLTGQPEDEELFAHLEDAYLTNHGANVYFALLADLADHAHMDAPGDEQLLLNAVSRIQALNQKYEPVFFLFLRPRSYSITQASFIGKDRKRGAVGELVSFLCGKGDAFIHHACHMPIEIANRIRFVLTLDSDTELPLEAVNELAGILLHPLNRVKLDTKSHRVTDGYGLLQPQVGPALEAARKTLFSRIFCGVSGTELYSFAHFELYQSLFGRSNFCGKGMLDKYAFYETLCLPDIALPEERVLSHDILEGERLHTAFVSDVTFTDSFPKNELSYLKRHHRWVRGDVQNLAFLHGHSFGALSRFKLLDNARRALTPVFSFTMLIVAALLPAESSWIFILAAILYEAIPFLWDIGRSVCAVSLSCAARRFFSKGVSCGLWQSLCRFILSLAMLPSYALVTMDAVLRALYRMCVSHKKLLEWVTAAQSDRAIKSDLLSFIPKNLPGSIVGCGLFLFSSNGFLRLLGLLWFFFPVIACHLSGVIAEKEVRPTEKQRKILVEYARAHWKLFENTVTALDHALPLDNLQLYPEIRLAHRTSPTNIGLYLASTLAARDLSFIDSAELYKRIEATLSTIEALPKWRGHLYNWYDTQALCVLEPRYVSGVDTGNFLACLIVTARGLCDYAHEEPDLLSLIPRLRALIQNTDLSCVYHPARKLFRIGISFDQAGLPHPEEACYDMLMTEARSLSYIGIAYRKIPQAHYKALSRHLVKKGDRLGLSSWSGTAFEYFMPALFMPTPRGSLLYEGLRFAFWAQRKAAVKTSVGPVWGISESGYPALDTENNYQYKAFGVPLLARQKRMDKAPVLSPYSSFLMLCMNITLPLQNLEKLKALGVYGEYGFYEAVDLSDLPKGEPCIVKSYMAHHVGMSLLAIENALLEEPVHKRFFAEPAMRCARRLLEEKIPVDAVVRTEESKTHRQKIR